MPNDIVISVKNVSKKFRLFSSPRERLIEGLHPLRKQYHKEFWALHDVSFEVSKGEFIGVLGRNGSGKSTLLQIICEVMQATTGSVCVSGKISALLELGAGFNPEFTGRENVILNGSIMGFSRAKMEAKMPEIEAFAEIGEHFDQPVKTYSSGMFVRVAFAAAIHVEPEILIIDEALSVGDARFQHRCFQRIREFVEQGKTILFVSHSADTLLRLCQRGLVIENGRVCYDGLIVAAVNHYQNLLSGPDQPKDMSDKPGQAGSGEVEQSRLLANGRADVVCERPFYNAHETRLGSGEAQIIDVEVLVDGRRDPPTIASGQTVELLVKLLFHKKLDGVSAGFAIVSLDGTYVFGTNLLMRKDPLLSADAGECLVVRFSLYAGLVGAEYFLDVGCTQVTPEEDRFLDVRRSLIWLKFADTPGITGFADLQVKYDVLSVPGLQEIRS
ncbi:ABC transporter ATP-binding protein [Pseudomonas gingeri]|uniref:ABC transporter ATP-binding protein n=1 Tax=Pseudomonas gingeri TaxID=117681 RepID=A0A7Y7WT83_9PSED|nr:ABC transporter ATP-binding protein [Pseudomonas gingeri]NWB87269.1 ABC transporter ATP-binding protein [Pseudomonas gingeri]